MNKLLRKGIIFAIVAAMICAGIAGCATATPTPTIAPTTAPTTAPTASPTAVPTATPSPTSAAVSVTDMKGNQISLDAPASKIVVLTASDCEILYAIGAGNTVVGRGQYCDYPAEVANVPSVQSGDNTNIEQIIKLKPQVVIMSTMAQTPDQVKSLENAGIKVFVSNAQDIAGVYTDIGLIGNLVGKNDEASAVIDNMKKTFADVTAKAAEKGAGKTIYFEVSPLQYGLWTAGSGTFMDEIATMLGLKNAFSDVKSWGQISEEQVMQRNPDYIVTITMYSGTGTKPIDEILGRKGWNKIAAVKNKAVFNIDTNELSRPGPRLADGAKALYDAIYGNS